MKDNVNFIHEDFLLQHEFSKKLYHGYAKDLPIIDYHCHLSPADIANDRQFQNLTQIWLEGDHYKWRAMRTLGIEEKFITGSASDEEKFEKWSYTVPYTMRNPLYHWTHIELSRYFGIEALLSSSTAHEVYETANQKLNTKEYSTRALLQKMKVEVVGTTDDPTDNLEHHAAIHASKFNVKILPTFRPDKAYDVADAVSYKSYLEKLSAASGININSYQSLLQALKNRIEFFHQRGCRLSDHGLERIFQKSNDLDANLEQVFKRLTEGKEVTEPEKESYRYSLLLELSRMYHAKGWTQQFHLGAMRNNNTRMRKQLGADSGFDSIGDYSQATNLSKFLNALDETNQLAKTILYNLNPSDNELFATMTGNFNDGSSKGKIQFGSGWWFLDQKNGMEKQINALSNMSLLSCFIGMITDSRSFLSYPRHEYFRRILCNLIGKDVANGELPADEKWLGQIVSDVCYFNAKNYFRF